MKIEYFDASKLESNDAIYVFTVLSEMDGWSLTDAAIAAQAADDIVAEADDRANLMLRVAWRIGSACQEMLDAT